MKYSSCASPGSVCSKCWTCSETTSYVKRRRSYKRHEIHACRKSPISTKRRSTYSRIKSGLRRSNPAAIVLWAFHNLPSENGLTSRRVIAFLKKHYKVLGNPRNTGKAISTMMRCAVDFGLLKKRRNKFYLASQL